MGRKETIMTRSMVDKILDLVQPGDIVLSYEAQRFTSLFIPSKWDHASIVSDLFHVVEAVGDDKIKHRIGDGQFIIENKGGVRELDFTEWLYKKDHVCVIRPVMKDNELAGTIAGNEAKTFVGRNYDYKFKLGVEELYCSELVYISWKKAYPHFLSHIPLDKEILPVDYLKVCGKSDGNISFQLIFNTREA